MRRQNLDVLISQIRPGYLSSLSELRKIVDSKNALLRMERPNVTMLDIMDEKLAGISESIIMYRSLYINRIEKLAKDVQFDISGGSEKLEMRYNSCIGDACGLDADAIGKAVRDKIAESREREMRLNETIIGPHREDIGFFINGTEAKLYASQGQQKTIVMAEKLAEVELLKAETGENPVLLLDDIMSELDKSRREYILGSIKDVQILITCTDTDGMYVGDEPRRIRVENGRAEVL